MSILKFKPVAFNDIGEGIANENGEFAAILNTWDPDIVAEKLATAPTQKGLFMTTQKVLYVSAPYSHSDTGYSWFKIPMNQASCEILFKESEKTISMWVRISGMVDGSYYAPVETFYIEILNQYSNTLDGAYVENSEAEWNFITDGTNLPSKYTIQPTSGDPKYKVITRDLEISTSGDSNSYEVNIDVSEMMLWKELNFHLYVSSDFEVETGDPLDDRDYTWQVSNSMGEVLASGSGQIYEENMVTISGINASPSTHPAKLTILTDNHYTSEYELRDPYDLNMDGVYIDLQYNHSGSSSLPSLPSFPSLPSLPRYNITGTAVNPDGKIMSACKVGVGRYSNASNILYTVTTNAQGEFLIQTLNKNDDLLLFFDDDTGAKYQLSIDLSNCFDVGNNEYLVELGTCYPIYSKISQIIY